MGEMSTLLLDGQRVVPGVALAGGYSYRFPTLQQALRALAAPVIRDTESDDPAPSSGRP